MVKKRKTQTTRIVTTGSAIRIEQPKSSRSSKPNVAVIVGSDLNPVNGFVDFLREHAIVGLAVGFAIGTQAQSLVKQLTDSFISPLLSLIIKGNIQTKQSIVHIAGRTSQPFTWGKLIYAFINFLFVMVVIYALIKLFNLDKLDKPKID
jgi:large-conductance mechanosensitive channel